MNNQRGNALSIEVVDQMAVEHVMEELLGSVKVLVSPTNGLSKAGAMK